MTAARPLPRYSAPHMGALARGLALPSYTTTGGTTYDGGVGAYELPREHQRGVIYPCK